MLNVLKNRFEQGCRTSAYPNAKIELPARYRGLAAGSRGRPAGIGRPDVRPPAPRMPSTPATSGSIWAAAFSAGPVSGLSEGRFVSFSRNFEMSVAEKNHLLTDGTLPDLARHAKTHFKKLFGRSLQLRQVSAAGCNACEADLNVLATPFFDLARFGINFVASPRHSDGIVVTGPISRNMKTALLQTYEAVPAPKVVIAVGSCTLSGGPFRGSPEITEGLDQLLPVDLFIPGCPPHPLTNLHALLTFFK